MKHVSNMIKTLKYHMNILIYVRYQCISSKHFS
jgi:hypothetical protein